MSEKIEGIILDSIRFRENSVIAKIFTKERGLLSIVINGLGNKKAKFSLVYLQPLTHIECTLYFKDTRSLNKVTDIAVVNSSLGFDHNIVKSSMAMFIAEIVLRTSKDSIKDNFVFTLLMEIIRVFSIDDSIKNSLHVYFLVKYSEALGFLAITEHASEYFKEEYQLEAKLVQISILKEYVHIEMTKNERKSALNYLLFSLSSNIGIFDLQSHKILEEIMS